MPRKSVAQEVSMRLLGGLSKTRGSVQRGRRVAARPPIDVLLIEDDLATRETLVETLESAGMRPRAFASAQAGLRQYRKNPAEVTLVDMKMKEMDGIEAARKLKSFDPQACVIAVTAYVGDYRPLDRDRIVDRWVLKPVATPASKASLIAEIREAAAPSSEVVKDLSRSVSRLARAINANDRIVLDDKHGFVVLLAASVLANAGGIDWRTFSHAVFSELSCGREVRDALSMIGVENLADAYSRDLKLLERLVRE